MSMNGILILFLFFYFSLNGSVYIKCFLWSVSIIYLLLKKKFMLMVIMIILILRSLILPVNLKLPVTGVVSKVYDASFQIRTVYGTVQCITDQQVCLDSIVEIDGTLLDQHQSSAFVSVSSISDFAIVADRVEMKVQLWTLRSLIYQWILTIDDSLTQSFLKKSILRLSTSEELLESLDSIQVVMMISLLKGLFRKFINEKKWRKIESLWIVFFCLLWDLPFVCFRLLYFKMMKTTSVSNYDALGLLGVLVYLFSVSLASSPLFWFVFLLRIIAVSVSDNRCMFLFFIGLIQLCFSCCVDFFDLLLFRLNQVISILSFFIGWFILVFDMNALWWMKFIDRFYSCLPSFELRGSISLVSICFLYLLFSMMNKQRQQFYILLMTGWIALFGTNPFGRIIFLNVGQGDAILIQSPLSFKTVLIDTGPPSSYRQLKKSLYGQSVYEIDLLVLTHKDNDHSGNKEAIMQDFEVKRIWDNTMSLIEDKEFSLRQINDIDISQNENENSLVLVSQLNGLSILLCGDATKQQEQHFAERINETMDICKIGHHGSDTSTSWKLLDTAGCPVAIISAGLNNRYGHPHEAVVERLSQNGSLVLNTAVDGDIQMTLTRFFHLITTSSHESVIIIKG